MISRFKWPVRVAALVAAVASCGVAAHAQGTLQGDLEKTYKPAKMGTDSTGTVVVEAGTVLTLQKGGVLGVPYDNMVFCTKIEIIQKDEKVIFSIVECDSCNNVQSASQMKSQIVFHYPKGYLEGGADAGQVGDIIGQVLTPAADSGGDQQQAAAPADQGQQQQAAAPAAAAAPPASVEIGMTPDQVVGILGQPEKVLNIGPKQIYVYKDIKVTFLNGKVADAQ